MLLNTELHITRYNFCVLTATMAFILFWIHIAFLKTSKNKFSAAIFKIRSAALGSY